MPGKISAIDRRYVFGLERMKVSRVIPIKEVTTESLHPIHRTKRFFEAVDGRRHTDPAEIPRGKDREKIKAYICRRGPVSHDRLGILLKIVRRKHMVLRRDKRFKEVPSLSRSEAQDFRLRIRQRALIGARRLAYPPCNCR